MSGRSLELSVTDDFYDMLFLCLPGSFPARGACLRCFDHGPSFPRLSHTSYPQNLGTWVLCGSVIESNPVAVGRDSP